MAASCGLFEPRTQDINGKGLRGRSGGGLVEPWIEDELRGMESRKRPPRRRAMLGLIFPVVSGTAVGLSVPISPIWFWVPGAMLLLPLFVWVRKNWSTGPLMLAAFFLMAAHARQATGVRSSTSLAVLMDRPMEYVQFVAMAEEDAAPQAAQPGRPAGAAFSAQVEGMNRDGVWRRTSDRIRVVLVGELPGGRLPRYGERWRLRGIVRPDVPRRS